MTVAIPDRLAVVRRGQRLTWATIAYNSLEAMLSVAAGLLVGSLVVMPLLARAKRRVAAQLASRALTAEARQTEICIYLSRGKASRPCAGARPAPMAAPHSKQPDLEHEPGAGRVECTSTILTHSTGEYECQPPKRSS